MSLIWSRPKSMPHQDEEISRRARRDRGVIEKISETSIQNLHPGANAASSLPLFPLSVRVGLSKRSASCW
jgi:hypothetical protein